MNQRERTIWVVAAVMVVIIGCAIVVFNLRASSSERGDSAALKSALSTSAAALAPAAAATAETIAVHVVGAVAKPGLYRLPTGARNIAAITAAGGFAKKADQASVNLAQLAVDGSQLIVAVKGKTASGLASGVAGGSQGATATQPKVSLNQADASALEQLDKIGPALAGRIIEFRTNNGGFTSVEQLLEVSGIGEKVFAGIKDHVTL